MNKLLLPALLAALTFGDLPASAAGAGSDEGFTSIFDGKSFDGWKIGDEAAKSWRIEEGAFVAQGTRSHIFYVGEESHSRISSSRSMS
jgi:hypothetical protein